MFILKVVGEKHPLEFFLQNKHQCKTFFFFFTFQITAFNCWYFLSALHTSLRAWEYICNVRVKFFKVYCYLNFYFKKVKRIKMERRINDIKSSTCPSAREPGGSAGMKIFHSTLRSTKRQLGKQHTTGLPFPDCRNFRELSDFVFHSKHKLFSVCGNWGFFVCSLHTMGRELHMKEMFLICLHTLHWK